MHERGHSAGENVHTCTAAREPPTGNLEARYLIMARTSGATCGADPGSRQRCDTRAYELAPSAGGNAFARPRKTNEL